MVLYAFLGVLTVGVTIYRVRRREHRELVFHYVLIALLLAGMEGIYLLPSSWERVAFWTVCAGLLAWALAFRRVAQR